MQLKTAGHNARLIFHINRLPLAGKALKENGEWIMHDIIVVGGGPAGLTAAIYGLRAGKTVLVIEKNGFGGQIAYSPKVENIPGTKVISGA